MTPNTPRKISVQITSMKWCNQRCSTAIWVIGACRSI